MATSDPLKSPLGFAAPGWEFGGPLRGRFLGEARRTCFRFTTCRW